MIFVLRNYFWKLPPFPEGKLSVHPSKLLRALWVQTAELWSYPAALTEAAGSDPTPALSMQKTSRCWPHSRGGWTVVTGNKTVWNWLAVPLKPSTELNFLDWTGIPRIRYPQWAVTSYCLIYVLLAVPNNCKLSVSRGSLGIPQNCFWDCTSVCVPYHDTASALEGFQLSFNLLARLVLGLNWCSEPGKKS